MLVGTLLGKFSHDLAIDLGTSNTLIYAKGLGIVLNEPSVVTIKRNEKGGNEVLALGNEAKMMLGRTPENIEAIRPLKDGVIADFEITKKMLRHFIKTVHHRRRLIRPQMVIAVPVGITPVERKAIIECAKSAGGSEVFLIEEPIAAAIGARLPITDPVGNMVVDIGGGTTEVAVISLGAIVYSKSVRVAGDKMDQAIMQHVNRDYKFLIGPGTAEMIKTAIGGAFPSGKIDTIEVKGRELISGIPKTLILDSEEVRKIISEEVNAIVQTVRIALEQIPPELSADILDKGIVLTGGGALLRNLFTLLIKEIKVPITIAETPLLTVALGAGKALENISLLREVSIE